MLMRARVRRAAQGIREPSELAAALNVELERAFLLTRLNARRAGLRRLLTELSAWLPGLGLGVLEDVQVTPLDRLRARQTATGFVNGVTKDAIAAQQSGKPGAVELALDNRARGLRSRAATQASEAFSAERSEALKEFAYRHPAEAETLIKVWDSVLDHDRTCETCAGAHGSWVYLHEDFPEGEPGGVHANCLCSVRIDSIEYANPLMRAA